MKTVHIGYKVEDSHRGWMVLRKRTGEPWAAYVKAAGSTTRIQYFPKREGAIEEIQNQVKADRAACTRLGLHVDESTAVDGTVLTIF